ncbi:MAG: glycosyltransferase [Methylococcaceae bacterium]|nr:glycosyltransferase [Methylococcaceae bacterium]
MAQEKQPQLLVFSSLFPSNKRPNAGVFVRERMFRVAQHTPLIVVSPVPWFPLQGLIRLWRPNYRPQPQRHEVQSGVDVYFPRFLSIPGLFRSYDGLMMALGSLPTLFKLRKQFNLIDAHFAYPDGYAATLLGQWLHKPVTITLRGTEVPLSKIPARKALLLTALAKATRVFAVANALKQHVMSIGADGDNIRVVGNGIDVDKFQALPQHQARAALNLPEHAKVLVSVGGLVDRKGFHRVIDILPELVKRHPDLIYLVVGGDSPEGNIRARLEAQVQNLNLSAHVRFLGAYPSEQLKLPLSAADVFVLATANEGWANVFLEAMACGLPVITTDVGGNAEVVNHPSLGTIVPFGDSAALQQAVADSLATSWDSGLIRQYAHDNAWDTRVSILMDEFRRIIAQPQP